MRKWWRRLWHRLTCGGYIDTINYTELCRDPAHKPRRHNDGCQTQDNEA